MVSKKRNYHVVRQGDTLWLIAQKYGVNVELLYALNPRIDAKKLWIGQKINLP